MSIVAVGAGPALAQGQPGPPPGQDLKRRLIDATGGRGRLADHAETGKVRFFGTEPTRAVARPG
ncbi:MAG: hypothetical protein LC733_07925, partial [Actinobacteria bacterium]|nr:hypothetical protein [Actinomycetota bacterium]